MAHAAANPRMYNAIINSNNPQLSNIIRQQQRQSNLNDPFSKVNLKARNIIESVERNRHSTAERRTGSTGGSSDSNVVDISQIQANQMNQTTQNFYSPKKIPEFDPGVQRLGN